MEKKKSIFKKWWFYVAIIAVLALIGAIQDKPDNEKEKVSQEIEKDSKETETTSTNDVGAKTVTALQSNDFMEFANEYKELGTNKTPVWNEQLVGRDVQWTGTVVDAGSSQVYLYGDEGYNSESWSDLGSAEGNKLFYSFVAKYDDPKQFEGVKQGDKITVEGSLDSRGDYDLNYNWKIYNAKLIQ